MSVHLFREIDRLKAALQKLSTMVDENLRNAIQATLNRDRKLALRVIARDHEIDREEVGVEEECLKTLALYQPVAHDLRYVMAILKINHALERVGDLAASIAERAVVLSETEPVENDFGIPALAARVHDMLHRSLDAFIHCDVALAKAVWMEDDCVDEANQRTVDEIEQQIENTPKRLRGLLALIAISRNLERMADHVANICKDIIYMVDGDIVRHRSRFIREQTTTSPGAN